MPYFIQIWNWHITWNFTVDILRFLVQYNIIIYHDFLPPTKTGSHFKSDYPGTEGHIRHPPSHTVLIHFLPMSKPSQHRLYIPANSSSISALVVTSSFLTLLICVTSTKLLKHLSDEYSLCYSLHFSYTVSMTQRRGYNTPDSYNRVAFRIYYLILYLSSHLSMLTVFRGKNNPL